MNILAVLFGVLAAIVGGLIWTAITYFTGYQIGFMAIGVGALVGVGVRLGDGEGKPMALYAGGLALAAMFVGNVLTIQVYLNQAVSEFSDYALSREAYEEEFAAADKFVFLPEEEYAQFVFEHTGYTEAATPDEVTEEEIQYFLEDYAPDLRRLHEERPNYNVWRARNDATIREAFTGGMSTPQMVFDSFEIVDVIFMVLGLFAAMRVVGEWE